MHDKTATQLEEGWWQGRAHSIPFLCQIPCPSNYSQGKMFLYLFLALLSSATEVDEADFFSTDYKHEVYL